VSLALAVQPDGEIYRAALEIYRATLDLGPGASVTRTCPVKLPSAGSFILRAAVQGTSDLRFDEI
jgi:hypothetical protein